MSLRWVEGFEAYGTSPEGGETFAEDGVWAEIGGFSLSFSEGIAATGRLALTFGASLSGATCYRTVGVATPTLGCAFRFRYGSTGTGAGLLAYLSRSGASEVQCGIGLVYDPITDRFKVAAYRGTSDLLGESAPVVDRLSFEHFEMLWTVNNSGSVEVRVNDVTVLSLSGVDTQWQDSDVVNYIGFGPGGFPWTTMQFDDIVLWDTTGNAPTDFIGQYARVFPIRPNGDTATSDWTRNAGSNDYEAIDDLFPDDDTSYIAAASVSDVSEFTLEDLPAEAVSVIGAQLYSRTRKDAAGTCNLQPALISNSAVANGDDRALGESYAYQGPIANIFDLDPDTGAPWTVAAFNATNLRITRTA